MQEVALKLARRQARKRQRFLADLIMILQAIFLLVVGVTIAYVCILLLGVTIAVLG
jgi:hypothetical protein